MTLAKALPLLFGLFVVLLFSAACSVDSDEAASDNGSSANANSSDGSSNSTEDGSTDSDGTDSDGTDSDNSDSDGTDSDIPSALAALSIEVDWTQVTAIDPVRLSAGLDEFPATAEGVIPDDGQSDLVALRMVLSQAANSGGVVVLPDGVLNLERPLDIPNGVVLRGSGSSVLDFDLAGADADLVTVVGAPATGWGDLAIAAPIGTTTLDLNPSSAPPIGVGDIVEIQQGNTSAMVTNPDWDVDWGQDSVGELAEVTGVSGSTIEIDHGLFSGYSLDRSPQVRVIDVARRAGIENLKIVRSDQGYGSNIRLSFAAEVWVSNVESVMTTRAHIETDMVYRCNISGNLLHGAHDFGDGGRAYGISTARHTTGCLITNNTLFDLRHALIIQLGASGNVLAYNHARGSAGYEDRQPRADVSLHGHWPQANLYEGNVLDRVEFADWWGPVGPDNTFHRNCILTSVLVGDSSNDQVLVGNIIGDEGLTIEDGITGTTNRANRIQGTPVDRAESPASLYFASQPKFLDGLPWPAIAPESGDPSDRSTACAIPAGARSPLGVS